MLDILAFGSHPDDAEIGCGGTLALHAARGERVGICDLTRGELGTGGDPKIRGEEAEAAARILGVSLRLNLGLPDGGLIYGAGGRGAGGEQKRRIVEVIRRLRPRVVLVPWHTDRHPDHTAAHYLLNEAIFAAALEKYDAPGEPHRVERVLYYFINDAAEPSLLVDVSATWEKKRESLLAHRSQFDLAASGVETPLNKPWGLLYKVEARDRYFGSLAGVAFAEGFVARQPLLLPGVL
ncbi:MAG: bacillithiol biosynthesis deacetylase BshB1 [Firmicutes bacterium]|nr:bacillithiol biosynthesis deacetylase BshB1 [Bacillota bacterium]